MANFFDQFDAAAEPTARVTVTKGPDYGESISAIESGGNYKALGPVTRTGDQAFGKYQVMGANVGPWTKEVLGKQYSRQEFLESPEIQDAVFKAKFGGYVDKYGPEGAAKAWFAGEKGMKNPNARDQLGTSVADYGSKFLRGISGQRTAEAALPPPQTNPAPEQTGGNFFDQFDSQPDGPVAERFPDQSIPGASPQLKSGLEAAALDMTRGPRLSPSAQMAGDLSNMVPTASQNTSPNVENYGGKLVSTDVFEDDAGNVLYRDPQTGQVKPTDQTKQVAIRDPADGVVKVFDRSPETDQSSVVGLARVLAPGLGAGAVTSRAALSAAPKIVPKASEIFSSAKPYYRAFKNEAGKIEVPAETAAGIASQIRGALDKANLIEELAKPVYSAVAILDKGTPMTLDALQNIKRVVGRSFSSPDKNVRDAAAVASGEIGKIISQVSKTASENLKKADAIHSTARSVQDLQRKSDVADLRAGRAGYGGNAVNSMRQVLSPIVQRAVEGKTTGFKPDEIQAMREIVEGTTATNSLRGVGQLSPSKGVIQTVGAGGAMYAAGPIALAIPAIGAASNKLATILTGKQIDRLKELVAKRSPAYAESVAKSVERYERAQMQLINEPGPNRLAAYISASRALSSGLQRDGVAISSGELLKAIRGPVQSAADGEEPQQPREFRSLDDASMALRSGDIRNNDTVIIGGKRQKIYYNPAHESP